MNELFYCFQRLNGAAKGRVEYAAEEAGGQVNALPYPGKTHVHFRSDHLDFGNFLMECQYMNIMTQDILIQYTL